MKNNNITKIAFSLILIIAIITACNKSEKASPSNPVAPNNEAEVITTMQLTFIDTANTANVVTAIFNDPDGDGGNAPTQHDTITLVKGTVYNVSLLLFDKTKTPVDTISNEVAEEADEHFFVYKFVGTPVSSIGFTYKDQDSNTPPLPLGLSTQWVVLNSIGTGTVQVILRHQPGVKNGTETPGDTDMDVIFQTKIN